MVTNEQVRKLMKLINTEKMLSIAVAKSGMSEKTARKWPNLQKLPDQCHVPHTWMTRRDPFFDVWDWVEVNPCLHAKTLFVTIQRMYPERFQDCQLRTFQRKVKHWRAEKGPAKEVFFPQVYRPGEWSESDFTSMNSLDITIAGCPFKVYALPLCSAILQLGRLYGRVLRKFREPQYRFAKCILETWRSTSQTQDRPSFSRSTQA